MTHSAMEVVTSFCCWSVEPDNDDELTEASPLIPAHVLPAFTYQDILPNEFRVVVLHPAQNFNDGVEIHLQTRQRSDNKFYEAVSYTWGTDQTTDRLYVHDEKFAASHLHDQYIFTRMFRYYQTRDRGNAELRVRSNVTTMLRYLRYKWLPRYLWIDAICINQRNMEEKSQQVNQMGDIYRKSGRTLIWLGSSKIYPRPLSALEAAARARRSKFWGISEVQVTDENRGPNQPDIQEILTLPWFHRRWVIQEVALSQRPRVVFGHDTMPFEDMTFLINQLRGPHQESLKNSSAADSLYRLESMTSLQRRQSFRGSNFLVGIKHDVFQQYYQYHPKTNDAVDFIQLLVSMCSAQCSDDRDRIYSLNSLGGRPTSVDYQDSTEVVFTRFATDECSQSLETLYCCGAFPSKNLPTFVPDWRSPRHWIPIKSFEGRPPSHLLFSESPRQCNLPPHRPVFIESRIMVVHAIPFASVVSKGPQLHYSWHSEPWLMLRSLVRYYLHRQDLPQKPIEIHSLDQVMKTLTAGAIQSGTNLEGWLRSHESLQDVLKGNHDDMNNCCDSNDKCFCEYPQIHINVHNILQRIERILQGRCSFISDRGDWGVGPASMLLGDQVVALPGCRFPLVLRPVASGVPMTFRIVGDCYITPFEGYKHLSGRHTVRSISIV
ncbi:heterokaryon incompatibility protein-domain-containing protein [Phaeosphaeriaceae sp. PMI808]|nr:heterokaryon incompatibility protein-domain-containing protein [Phaeosphaeriaceae sp. PMI808]